MIETTRQQTVGVVGLGNMGLAMAMRMRSQGLEVIGCDISEPRQAAARDGGIETVSLDDMSRRSAVVLLSLPLASHVEQVVAGIAPRLARGVVIVDTSTSEAATSRRLAKECGGRGIGFLDAPVSGGPAGAAAGSLTMMIGGDADHVAQAEGVLSAVTAKRLHVGGPGAGNVAKLVNNMLVAAHLLTMAEGLRLAQAAGVSGESVLAVVNAASGRSAVSEVNYPRWIASGTFDSGFTMGLMRKDVRLAAALAAEVGADLPVLQLAARMWQKSAQALGDEADFNRITTLPP